MSRNVSTKTPSVDQTLETLADLRKGDVASWPLNGRLGAAAVVVGRRGGVAGKRVQRYRLRQLAGEKSINLRNFVACLEDATPAEAIEILRALLRDAGKASLIVVSASDSSDALPGVELEIAEQFARLVSNLATVRQHKGASAKGLLPSLRHLLAHVDSANRSIQGGLR